MLCILSFETFSDSSYINYHCCVWGRTASVRLYQYPCLLVTHPEEAAKLWSPTVFKYQAQTLNGSSHLQSEINLNFCCFWNEIDCCTTTFSICQSQGPTLLLTVSTTACVSWSLTIASTMHVLFHLVQQHKCFSVHISFHKEYVEHFWECEIAAIHFDRLPDIACLWCNTCMHQYHGTGMYWSVII